MFKFNKETNYYKNILQLVIIGLLIYMVIRVFVDADYFADYEAYCPFGGMMALSSFFVSNTLACSMTEAQIFMGVVLAVGVILFSKLFCSHICPLGTFTEWLGKIGDKFKMRYTIKGFSDRILRIFKYALLFITFYFTISSSELFCKEYDPFYAIFTGFGHDVFFWYALPAILIMVLGAIFIRQFWCKYLCPLSAATNIFSYAIMFVAVMAIYLILLYFDFAISWVWPLAIICALGFLFESISMKGWIFPTLKITRNEITCTECEECDMACPMGINISTEDKVKHIDCHLCGDCLHVCPEKETLKINKKEAKWLPSTATVGLVLVGLFLATTVELPTINMKWGSDEQINQAGIFTQSGLKNIKCYGSSRSFASQMQRIPGIFGVETYVQSHTVKVYYDTNRFDYENIKEKIFTPTKTLLRNPEKSVEKISVLQIGINKLFDTYDSFYLRQLLRQQEGIYGIKTEFGEPVKALIYYNPEISLNEEIKNIIEVENVTYASRGKEYKVPLIFEVAYINDSTVTISETEFRQQMFNSYNQVFNDYKQYKDEELSIYRISMPQAANPGVNRQLSYLISHLSTDTSIVRFSTQYIDGPVADIYFLKDAIDEKGIYTALSADTMTVHYSGGKTGKVKNPFRFPKEGTIIKTE